MNHETMLSLDGALLTEAQNFYELHGFEQTDTPWLVAEEAYMATCPQDINGRRWHAPSGLFHVASAEQGFIQMLLSETYVPEKAQSTTPCFRWEEQFDEIHHPFFYKTELYWANHDNETLTSMIALARMLFQRLGITTDIKRMEDESIDLVCDQTGIELGSYGKRSFQGFTWTYGTGLALPRFSYVKTRRSL